PAAARLLGETNLLAATVSRGKARTAFGEVPATAGATVMARPEAVLIGDKGVSAVVSDVLYAGATSVVTLQAEGQTAQARLASNTAPKVGEQVKTSLDPALCVVFP